MGDFEGIPFLQARYFNPLPSRTVDVLVIHTMEAPEKPTTALACAKWFASPTSSEASAHFCVDSEHVVQCVLLKDVAWAAPGANTHGVHIELAGYAKQSPEEWHDDFSRAMLDRAAQLGKLLCLKFDIPRVKLSPGELHDKKRGVCGHWDVTQGLNDGKGHTDPGPHFPWDEFIQKLNS